MAENGYIGRSPGDAAVIVARQTFSPSGVTTDFTFSSGYTVGYMDVYLNGVRLIDATDYTASNGSTVGLSSAAQSGDVLELVAYKAFNLGQTVDQITGDLDLNGKLTVTGISTLGNVVSSGIVTADSFYGDGSNLTGLPGQRDFWTKTAAGINTTVSVGIGTTRPDSIARVNNTSILNVGILTAYQVYTGDSGTIGGKLTVSGITSVGDVVSSGIVTADSFYGSGANLTGIDGGVAGVSTTGFSTFKSIKATGISTFGHVGSSGTSVFIQGNVKCEAINSIGIGTFAGLNPGTQSGVGTATGTLQYNSTTQVVEVYQGTLGGWIPASQTYSGVKATGGSISQAGGKIIHTFSGAADFKVHTAISGGVDYLIVGGGGGMYVGGGGGGGVHYKEAHPVSTSPGVYPITVGAGGAHATSDPYAAPGGDSTAFGVTAEGGGGTAHLGNAPTAPGAGGSGGGSYFSPPYGGGTGSGDPGGASDGRSGDGVDAASPTNGWGNDGGGNGPATNAGGGGGGAGGSGQAGGPTGAGSSKGGAGGDGLSFTISGARRWYGAGGGGGGYPAGTAGNQGLGGKYGGGTNRNTVQNEHQGQKGTGAGGGGGYAGTGSSNGGSGIVIIAYPNT